MRKRKVLFVISEMRMGGSRKSLCSLLKALNSNKQFELSLLNMSSTGELLCEVPESVKIQKVSTLMKAFFASKDEISLPLLLLKLLMRMLCRIRFGNRIQRYIIDSWYKKTPQKFDVVVGCQEGTSDELSLKIPGEKHVIWFHCDYDKYCSLVDETAKENVYSLADNVVFVSEKSREAFSRKFPNLSSKCLIIRNIIDRNEILRKAESAPTHQFGDRKIRIVSVGRLSTEKGFDRIADIVKRVKDAYYDVEWVIIGGGDLLRSLQAQIKERELDNYVHFIGQATNPYPIIKQADLYVMTSHFEAQPLVLIEALVLGIPVLSTDFTSVREVITGTNNYGKVVENSIDGIAEGLIDILKKDELPKMKEAAEAYTYDNSYILSSVERLLN